MTITIYIARTSRNVASESEARGHVTSDHLFRVDSDRMRCVFSLRIIASKITHAYKIQSTIIDIHILNIFQLTVGIYTLSKQATAALSLLLSSLLLPNCEGSHSVRFITMKP